MDRLEVYRQAEGKFLSNKLCFSVKNLVHEYERVIFHLEIV
jgi:hypothetical protein